MSSGDSILLKHVDRQAEWHCIQERDGEMCACRPRRMNRSETTSMTSFGFSRRATLIASASQVSSSTMSSIRIWRPAWPPASTKSSAQTRTGCSGRRLRGSARCRLSLLPAISFGGIYGSVQSLHANALLARRETLAFRSTP